MYHMGVFRQTLRRKVASPFLSMIPIDLLRGSLKSYIGSISFMSEGENMEERRSIGARLPYTSSNTLSPDTREPYCRPMIDTPHTFKGLDSRIPIINPY